LGADNYNGGHEKSFVKPSLPTKSSEIRHGRHRGGSLSPLRSVVHHPLVHDDGRRRAGVERAG